MRVQPRIAVEKLANEVIAERERLGLIVDLSATGLRLEGRSFERRESGIVQLEFEMPDVDEIVWAKAEVCFDRVHARRDGMIRSTGVRIVAAARRHLEMLREWVAAARLQRV
jgi:hypothetical protein